MARSFRKSLGRVALVALAALAMAPSAQAEVNRARVELASVTLQGAEPRQCWARYSTSAGQARGGAIEEVAFRVPCPEVMRGAFLETLQRALMARGFHEGPVTGVADLQTRAAVQAYQRANGFDSPILTLETAQRLGLVAIEITRN